MPHRKHQSSAGGSDGRSRRYVTVLPAECFARNLSRWRILASTFRVCNQFCADCTFLWLQEEIQAARLSPAILWNRPTTCLGVSNRVWLQPLINCITSNSLIYEAKFKKHMSHGFNKVLIWFWNMILIRFESGIMIYIDMVFGYDFEMILDMKSRWNRCGLDMILTWLWYGLGTKWLCGVPVGWHEKWKRGRLLKCFLILIRCVYDVYMILMFSKHIPKNHMNCKKTEVTILSHIKITILTISETCWNHIKIMTAKTVHETKIPEPYPNYIYIDIEFQNPPF